MDNKPLLTDAFSILTLKVLTVKVATETEGSQSQLASRSSMLATGLTSPITIGIYVIITPRTNVYTITNPITIAILIAFGGRARIAEVRNAVSIGI
jgi:hypothetical protein